MSHLTFSWKLQDTGYSKDVFGEVGLYDTRTKQSNVSLWGSGCACLPSGSCLFGLARRSPRGSGLMQSCPTHWVGWYPCVMIPWCWHPCVITYSRDHVHPYHTGYIWSRTFLAVSFLLLGLSWARREAEGRFSQSPGTCLSPAQLHVHHWLVPSAPSLDLGSQECQISAASPLPGQSWGWLFQFVDHIATWNLRIQWLLQHF